ncbi:YfcC family protein [Candidatus Saccharibacteria bacterium]|nr:YfcC family protein [Candidatus Saccharibacteria bacterium]
MPKKRRIHSKKARAMLSAYSIIMILIIALGILTHFLPPAKYQVIQPEEDAEASVEVGAGEWEGESPTGGPAEEPVEPTVGDEKAVTNETAGEAESEAEATGETEATSQSSEATTETETIAENSNETTESVAVTTTEEAAEESSEAVTYDSLEACEEKNGEEACEVVNGSGVVGAKLYQVLIAPILGFGDAIDVCIFVMILGGFLAVMAKTKALETGIRVLVKKLRGKEYILILLLMLIFSVMGTTYGFLEESVGFYVLIAATMFAAGMDPLVGVATILLGAGSGVLGSTINPFATGVALSAMKDAGVEYNQGTIIFIATVLWLTTLAISAFFVIKYARKVQRDKGSTFLSLREQAAAEKKYSKYLEANDSGEKLTGKQKVSLIVFALTFIVMIVGFIPWGEFGITFFDDWTGWLTGASLGNWWFYEAALWFLIASIIIAIINRQGEHGFVDTFVSGAGDMIGVVLVIAVARGASVLMAQTAMDNFIIYNASDWLATMPEMAFVPLNYLLHIVLSVLVPSSSGLATLSTPIITPLAANLGYSTNVAAMTIVAANGLVNLITPTCGAIMGGLALAKVDYTTWFKWGIRVVACIAVANIIVLCLFSL